MFSIRCTHCSQLINLNAEEIQTAVTESDAAKRTTYQMPCPKCRRPVKIQVRQLKLKLPRAVPESLDGKAAGAKSKDDES